MNAPGPINLLIQLPFTISLVMSSYSLLFSLNSIVSRYTNSLANALSLFPLPHSIVFTCLQSQLKSILCLLHADICLVDMTREEHKIMLTGLTLCS